MLKKKMFVTWISFTTSNDVRVSLNTLALIYLQNSMIVYTHSKFKVHVQFLHPDVNIFVVSLKTGNGSGTLRISTVMTNL